MSSQPTTPTESMPWRDLYLTIALAVARDGLPTLLRVSAHPTDHHLFICADTCADRDRWATRLSDATLRPDLGRTGHTDTVGAWHGWQVWISTREPEPGPATAPTTDDLSLAVVAAVEADQEERCPDPECGEPLRLIEAGSVGHCGRTCADESQVWACPEPGCGYHIADGPVDEDEQPTHELIAEHLAEHADAVSEPSTVDAEPIYQPGDQVVIAGTDRHQRRATIRSAELRLGMPGYVVEYPTSGGQTWYGVDAVLPYADPTCCEHHAAQGWVLIDDSSRATVDAEAGAR